MVMQRFYLYIHCKTLNMSMNSYNILHFFWGSFSKYDVAHTRHKWAHFVAELLILSLEKLTFLPLHMSSGFFKSYFWWCAFAISIYSWLWSKGYVLLLSFSRKPADSEGLYGNHVYVFNFVILVVSCFRCPFFFPFFFVLLNACVVCSATVNGRAYSLWWQYSVVIFAYNEYIAVLLWLYLVSH